jgi:predicted O-methyltransferase YrrM
MCGRRVDRYFGDLLTPTDDKLDAALLANEQGGLPPIDVTRLQGKFLDFLVRISGARRVLEIGTLGGYSTIWLARALPEGGRIVTLELDPHHAEVARANLQNAGVLDRVDLIVGPALERLAVSRKLPRPSISSSSTLTSRAIRNTSIGL